MIKNQNDIGLENLITIPLITGLPLDYLLICDLWKKNLLQFITIINNYLIAKALLLFDTPLYYIL